MLAVAIQKNKQERLLHAPAQLAVLIYSLGGSAGVA
jgi:hypothetical protein